MCNLKLIPAELHCVLHDVAQGLEDIANRVTEEEMDEMAEEMMDDQKAGRYSVPETKQEKATWTTDLVHEYMMANRLRGPRVGPRPPQSVEISCRWRQGGEQRIEVMQLRGKSAERFIRATFKGKEKRAILNGAEAMVTVYGWRARVQIAWHLFGARAKLAPW